MKCIVKNCENHSHQGKFIGELCSPCHRYITEGEGKYSQAYRNSKREWFGLTDEEMLAAIRPLYTSDSVAENALGISMDEYRAIEAALKEKNHD
jgi:Na+/phosphate symporter